MPTKSVLKEILLENEEFVLNQIKVIVERPSIRVPHPLKKVVILYGVRRSGKSYFLYDLFRKNPGKTLYIDFEDERLSDFGAEDFERLTDAFLELKPHLVRKEMLVLLDEVQNIPGWEKFCRRLVERTAAQVYVTGSSSRMNPVNIQTVLRGRSWGVELLPFNFREFLSARSFGSLQDNELFYGSLKPKIKNAFLDYLRWGGFPEVAPLMTDLERRKVLGEYLQAMFFKDLVEKNGVKNVPLLEKMTDMLFSSAACKVTLSSFFKKTKGLLPFSKDSLYEYYGYFLQSLLVYETRIFSPSHYKRARNPAKIYLVDSGIARKVASEDRGRLLENLVYLEYRRRGCEASYFLGTRECDFVAKNEGGGLECSQVTFEMTKENRDREVEGLVEACAALDLKKGTLFTFDDEDQTRFRGIVIDIVPAWKWLIQGQMPTSRSSAGSGSF